VGAPLAVNLHAASTFAGEVRAEFRASALPHSVATASGALLVTRKAGALSCSASAAGALTVDKPLHLQLVANTGAQFTGRASAGLAVALVAVDSTAARITVGNPLAAAAHAQSTIGADLARSVHLGAKLTASATAGAGVPLCDLSLSAVAQAVAQVFAAAVASPAALPLNPAVTGRHILLRAAPRSWNVTAESVPVARRDSRRAG
jgi:hypothetical protein